MSSAQGAHLRRGVDNVRRDRVHPLKGARRHPRRRLRCIGRDLAGGDRALHELRSKGHKRAGQPAVGYTVGRLRWRTSAGRSPSARARRATNIVTIGELRVLTLPVACREEPKHIEAHRST